jgi:WD40 repeat protein
VGFIRIWDPESGEQLQVLGGWELSPISALAWSPDGERLATGHEDGQLNLWALEQGSLTNTTQEHQARISSLAWSPDGRWLASADEQGLFLLWEGQSAFPIDRYEGQPRVQSIPDFEWFPGSTAASWAGPRGRAWFWNLEGDLVSLVPEAPENGEGFASVAISPDATTLALGSSTGLIRLWDLNSGDEYDPLDGHIGPVLDLDFSPDGSKLVSGGADGKLILWDINDRVGLRALRDKVNAVLGTAWSPDGRWIAAALDDGTVRVYGE